MKPLKLKNTTIVNHGNEQKEIKPKLNVPYKLYKYYTLNGNSASSLENETIHLSHPFTLNDVLDGNFALTSDYQFFFDSHPDLKAFYGTLNNFIQIFITELYTNVVKDWGIFSICETFDNDLIWSHYTNEEGFCIEFDSQKLFSSISEPKKHLFPVSYDLKRIDFKDYIIEDESGIDAWVPIVHSMASKEKCWKYEKEWRLLVAKEDLSRFSHNLQIVNPRVKDWEYKNLSARNLKFDSEAVCSILLGPYFFSSKRFDFLMDSPQKMMYWFKKPFDEDLYKFLQKIQKDYNSKTYQVNKRYVDSSKKYERFREYKIEIVELNESYVKIKRTRV